MPINTLTSQSKFYVPHWLKRSALVLAVSTSMVTGVTATAMASAQAVVTTADFSDLVQQVTPAVARVNVTKTVSEAELAQAKQPNCCGSSLVIVYVFLIRLPRQQLSMLMARPFLSPPMVIC